MFHVDPSTRADVEKREIKWTSLQQFCTFANALWRKTRASPGTYIIFLEILIFDIYCSSDSKILSPPRSGAPFGGNSVGGVYSPLVNPPISRRHFCVNARQVGATAPDTP